MYADFIKQQLELHPSITAQDVIKMCFQGAYGAEHLLTDIDKVQDYFLTEYKSCKANDEPVMEFIAPEVCRVNLKAWKRLDLPWEWLFNLFVKSASFAFSDGNSRFFSYVDEWGGFITEELCPPTTPTPVHHSQQYRDAEKPAYRVISGSYVRLIPILIRLSESYLFRHTWLEKGEHSQAHVSPLDFGVPCQARNNMEPITSMQSGGIISIDGRSASGKTTLATGLASVIGAEVIHMDDFFLPPELRTPERLNQPGGNVHYERFAQEVLPFLADKNQGFEYKIFDCKTMTYNGVRKIKPSNWRVVEGAYSHHPILGNYMTQRVFSDIDPAMQIERIKNRNGENVAKIYADKWIPMEEKYIHALLTLTDAFVVPSSNLSLLAEKS